MKSIACGMVALLAVTSSVSAASREPKHPPIHPGTAVVRAFALTALQHLKGPAQLPFLKLIKTLPPQAGEVEISKAKTQNITCDPASNTCVPTAPNAVLNAKDLESMLRSGGWTIATTADAPDIVVDAGFGWSSGNGLVLNAIGSIIVNQAIVVERRPNPSLQLIYNPNGTGGALSFGDKGSIVFWDLASSLVINGQSYILADDVQSLAQLIARNPSGNFALANSYNANQDGAYTQSPIPTALQGNFEGLGNTISNLRVESAGQGAGFFHDVAQSAKVENLNIRSTKMEVDGGTIVGGLADLNEGTLFSNSWSGDIGLSVNPSDSCAVGDLVGANAGTITYSHASGSINVVTNSPTDDTTCDVGGLVGVSGLVGTIQYSYALGPVTLTAQQLGVALLGGLAGDFESAFGGTIGNTFAVGAVTLNGGGIIGGLIGYDGGTGTVSNSSASGSVTGVDLVGGGAIYAGGLIGSSGSTGAVDLTVATGSVSATAAFADAGGALGLAVATVNDSFSFGTANATGSVFFFIGGFAGDANGASFSNDQWDMKTSKINDPGQGAGNIRYYPGITGF